MWGKEERLGRMSKKNEMQRKIQNKTESGPGEKKGDEMYLKAGKYQMDGKVEEQMTGKAWNYRRQKSPLMPRTPALGHIQAQGERDTQGQNLIDAENLQQEKEMTSQVEGRLTVARLKLFENSVKVVDFRKVTVDTIEEEASKKEDLSDKMRKITNEMRARTPRKMQY